MFKSFLNPCRNEKNLSQRSSIPAERLDRARVYTPAGFPVEIRQPDQRASWTLTPPLGDPRRVMSFAGRRQPLLATIWEGASVTRPTRGPDRDLVGARVQHRLTNRSYKPIEGKSRGETHLPRIPLDRFRWQWTRPPQLTLTLGLGAPVRLTCHLNSDPSREEHADPGRFSCAIWTRGSPWDFEHPARPDSRVASLSSRAPPA